MTLQAHLPDDLDGWLEYISGIHSKVIDLSLERITKVFQRLCQLHGNTGPVKPPLVITFAGTNGKGSTLAMVEAFALTAGQTVGAYTSPHLVRFNERIRINGTDATDDALIVGFAKIEKVRGDTPLTYFEYTTLVAFEFFLSADVGIWLLEVGLGGRLDAVNIIDPDIAVITTVDLDHQDLLGTDRETIGSEKAGILRRGIPLVLGSADQPQAVLKKACELGVDVYRPGKDFYLQNRCFVSEIPHVADVETGKHETAGMHVASGKQGESSNFTLELLNVPDLPAGNIAAALQVARLAGIDLTELARARFPELALKGRFQVVGTDPAVVLDVAHNPHAAHYLADWLSRNPVEGPDIAVFSALADKDIKGIVSVLADEFQQWHLFEIDDPRAISLANLAANVGGAISTQLQCQSDFESGGARGGARGSKPERCSNYGETNIYTHPSVAEALMTARMAAGKHGRILVFGSFLTVAAVMETGMIESR